MSGFAGRVGDMTKQKKLTARTPEDLLAVVPIVLGFHPEQSVVMLTFGATGGPPGVSDSFHARIDLPGPAELDGAVAPLLGAAVRHGVPRVAFVLYTADAQLADLAALRLSGAFGDEEIEVVAILRADDGRWYPVGPGAAQVGHPFDASAHPFAAESVYEGAVIHQSRAALASSLAARPEEVTKVDELVPAAMGRLGMGLGPAESRWVAGTVRETVASGGVLGAAEVARLVVALTEQRARDEAWVQITRAGSERQVLFWTDVLRRTPERLVPAPACFLAFSAWLSGQGALAWCALERCEEVAPGFPMAEPIALALDRAMPPRSWDDFEPPRRTASGSA